MTELKTQLKTCKQPKPGMVCGWTNTLWLPNKPATLMLTGSMWSAEELRQCVLGGGGVGWQRCHQVCPYVKQNIGSCTDNSNLSMTNEENLFFISNGKWFVWDWETKSTCTCGAGEGRGCKDVTECILNSSRMLVDTQIYLHQQQQVVSWEYISKP